MIDMSMERVRAVIDKACQDGKSYATIEKKVGMLPWTMLSHRPSTVWAIR